MKKKTYFSVPVVYEMYGTVAVEAETPEEAYDKVKNNPWDYNLPTDASYLEDSFEVADDDRESAVEMIKELSCFDENGPVDPEVEAPYEITDVGFDYDSLREMGDLRICGKCSVYGKSNGESTADDREFIYDPSEVHVTIRRLDPPEDSEDGFSESDYAKAQEMLLANINANKIPFMEKAKTITPRRSTRSSTASTEANPERISALKEKIRKGEDLTGCVAEYLDLFEDTDVMHRDVVESEIEELGYGGDDEADEAARLRLMLKDNPGVTYFDYYKEEPITFDWLRERLGMGASGAPIGTQIAFTYDGYKGAFLDSVDETEFDTADEAEVMNLFLDFVKENGFENVRVVEIRHDPIEGEGI